MNHPHFIVQAAYNESSDFGGVLKETFFFPPFFFFF
jgi:hypothetical protein